MKTEENILEFWDTDQIINWAKKKQSFDSYQIRCGNRGIQTKAIHVHFKNNIGFIVFLALEHVELKNGTHYLHLWNDFHFLQNRRITPSPSNKILSLFYHKEVKELLQIIITDFESFGARCKNIKNNELDLRITNRVQKKYSWFHKLTERELRRKIGENIKNLVYTFD